MSSHQHPHQGSLVGTRPTIKERQVREDRASAPDPAPAERKFCASVTVQVIAWSLRLRVTHRAIASTSTPAPGTIQGGKRRLTRTAPIATPLPICPRNNKTIARTIAAATPSHDEISARSWPDSKPRNPAPKVSACPSVQSAPPIASTTRRLPIATPTRAAAHAPHAIQTSRNRRADGVDQRMIAMRALPKNTTCAELR